MWIACARRGWQPLNDTKQAKAFAAGAFLYEERNGTMLYPPLDAFADETQSRYALVVAAAKRARQLMNGGRKLVETKADKPVTIALEEILAGKVSFEQPK